jgi:hypothetical protein
LQVSQTISGTASETITSVSICPLSFGIPGLTVFTGVAGKMLEGGKSIGSWQDLKDYSKASPWVYFGKHSFAGGWKEGEFDYVGNGILGGERLVLGFLGIAGGRPEPSPTPGAHGAPNQSVTQIYPGAPMQSA